jgi:pSer/pThr/pTyr-binding forkhead associated (FHA) protein
VLRVGATGVLVEDLGSRNGVRLNGELLSQPTALKHGDELMVVGHQLRLLVGKGKSGFTTTAPMQAATRPAEVFGVLGALADKALAMGHAQEAQRLLGGHLDNLLKQLAQGQRPNEATLEQALIYGARLASATRRGYWYGYVFRVLSLLSQVCPARVLDELYSGAGRSDGKDLQAIRDYIHSQRLAQGAMTPRERFLLNRVEGLERLLSA